MQGRTREGFMGMQRVQRGFRGTKEARGVQGRRRGTHGGQEEARGALRGTQKGCRDPGRVQENAGNTERARGGFGGRGRGAGSSGGTHGERAALGRAEGARRRTEHRGAARSALRGAVPAMHGVPPLSPGRAAPGAALHRPPRTCRPCAAAPRTWRRGEGAGRGSALRSRGRPRAEPAPRGEEGTARSGGGRRCPFQYFIVAVSSWFRVPGRPRRFRTRSGAAAWSSAAGCTR